MIRNKNTDNQTTQDDCSGEEILGHVCGKSCYWSIYMSISVCSYAIRKYLLTT